MGCTQSKQDIENGANDRDPHTHTPADEKHKASDKGRHSSTGKKHGKHHTHTHHAHTHPAHAIRSPQKMRGSFTGTHTNPMDPRPNFTNSNTDAANTSTSTSASTKTESAPLSPSPPPLSPTPSASVSAPAAVAGPPSVLSPSSLLAVSSPVSNNAPPPSPTGPTTAPLTPHNSLAPQTHTPVHTHTQEDNRSVDERSDRSGVSGPALSVSQHEQFRRKHYDELSKSTRSKNNILSVRGGRGGVRRPSTGSREATGSVSLPPTHSHALSVPVSGAVLSLSLASASYDSHADASLSSLAHSEKSDLSPTPTETSSRHAHSTQTEERVLSRPPPDTHSLTHSHNASSQSLDAHADAHTGTHTGTQTLAQTVTETTTTISSSPATCEDAPNESVPVSVSVSVPVPECESPKQQPPSSPPSNAESSLCDVLSPHVTLREKQRESMRLAHTHTLALAHNAPAQVVSTQNEITPHHTSLDTLSLPLAQAAEECEGAVCEREEQTVSVCVETVSVRETLTDTELSHTTTTMTTTTERVRVLHTLTQSPPRSRTSSQSPTDTLAPRSPLRDTATAPESEEDTQTESEAGPMKLFSKDMITTTGRARTAEQEQHEADKLRHFQRLGSATVVSNGSTPNRDFSRSLSSTLLGRPHPGRGGRGFSHSQSMHVAHAQAQRETSAPAHNALTQPLFTRSLPASPAKSAHSLSHTQTHTQSLPPSLSDDAAEHTTRPPTLSLPHRSRVVAAAAHKAPSQEVVEEVLSHSQRVGIAQRHEPISEGEVECESESDEKETSAQSTPIQEVSVAVSVVPLITQPAHTKSSLLLAQPRSVVTQQINAQHSQSFYSLPHTPAYAESESVREESIVGVSESTVRAESDKACESETQTHTHTQSVREKEAEAEITFADVYAPRGREKSRPSSRKSVVLSAAAVKQKEKDRASPTQHIQTQAQAQAETPVESSESVPQSLSPAVSLSEGESAKEVREEATQAPEPVSLSQPTETKAPHATVSATAEPAHAHTATTEPALTPAGVSLVTETTVDAVESAVVTTDATRKPHAASETEIAQPAEDSKDAPEITLSTRTVAVTKQVDTTTGRQNMRAFWAAKEKERERERDRRVPLSPTASMNAASLSAVSVSSVNTLSTVSVSEKETNVSVSSTSVSENVSQRETLRETASEERVVIETESTVQNARKFFLQQQLQQQKSSSRPGSDSFNRSSSVRGRGNAVR